MKLCVLDWRWEQHFKLWRKTTIQCMSHSNRGMLEHAKYFFFFFSSRRIDIYCFANIYGFGLQKKFFKNHAQQTLIILDQMHACRGKTSTTIYVVAIAFDFGFTNVALAAHSFRQLKCESPLLFPIWTHRDLQHAFLLRPCVQSQRDISTSC